MIILILNKQIIAKNYLKMRVSKKKSQINNSLQELVSLIQINMINKSSSTNQEDVFRISNIRTRSLLTIIISFLILIFILNAVFMDALFQMGVNNIHDMQTAIQSKVLSAFMNMFSLICNTPFIVLIFLLEMGLAKHKFKAIIHLSFFLIGFHFIAILKQVYQQSRPIWVSNQIIKYQWFCPTDFGNPSGHSYVSFPLFQPIISKYISLKHQKLAWTIVLIFAIVVPYSRMYLGVHSLNQVFFGLSFGLAWTVLYRYGMRRLFYKTLSIMLKIKQRTYLISIVGVHFILIAIPMIIFKIRSQNSVFPQEDLDNLNKICDINKTSISIQTSMLMLCILQSPCFGFMYGLYGLKYQQKYKYYFSGKWKYTSTKSVAQHCGTQLLVTAILPGIAVLIFELTIKQPYIKFILFNICLTIGGFLYIWLTPKLQSKYKWIKYDHQSFLTLEQQIQPKPVSENFEDQIKADNHNLMTINKSA